MPYRVLKAFYVLSHLILTTPPGINSYSFYLHFTEMQTDVPRCSNTCHRPHGWQVIELGYSKGPGMLPPLTNDTSITQIFIQNSDTNINT